jgi:hypothetical protein
MEIFTGKSEHPNMGNFGLQEDTYAVLGRPSNLVYGLLLIPLCDLTLQKHIMNSKEMMRSRMIHAIKANLLMTVMNGMKQSSQSLMDL